jgi:hypothetical protein
LRRHGLDGLRGQDVLHEIADVKRMDDQLMVFLKRDAKMDD